MRDSKRDTDVKNRLLDSVGEGEGGMIWVNSIETYILPYVKQMTSASLMHDTGYSNRCSGTTWRDRVGRQVGEQFRMEGAHVYLWNVLVTQSCPVLCDPMVCPWNSPGKITGVGCHSFLHGIFENQGSNPGLLHSKQILYHLSYQGSLKNITHIQFLRECVCVCVCVFHSKCF